MSVSGLIISNARKRLGCKENPPGSNDGACVRDIQSSTGMYRLPWCASFIVRIWEESGIDVSKIRTASTYYMVEYARDLGWLSPEPVPGCAVVWNPGASGHVEFYISGPRDRALTIGGNTGDAVREHYRSIAGAYFIVPPELRGKQKAEVVYKTVYWWEDRRAKPVMHGLHTSPESREAGVEKWVARWGNRGHVRRGKLSVYNPRTRKREARWTFWTGLRARSVDFASKAERDASAAKAEAARGRVVVRRSKKIPVS